MRVNSASSKATSRASSVSSIEPARMEPRRYALTITPRSRWTSESVMPPVCDRREPIGHRAIVSWLHSSGSPIRVSGIIGDTSAAASTQFALSAARALVHAVIRCPS